MSTDQEIQKRIEQLQARQRKLKAEKAVRLRKAEARAKIILGGQLLAWLQRQAELVTRLGEERDEAAKKKAVDAFNIRYKSLWAWPKRLARRRRAAMATGGFADGADRARTAASKAGAATKESC